MKCYFIFGMLFVGMFGMIGCVNGFIWFFFCGVLCVSSIYEILGCLGCGMII